MILRPEPKLVLVQSLDKSGRSAVTILPVEGLGAAQADAVAVLLALGEASLPGEPDDPAVAAVKAEIAALEARLAVLQTSLAAAASPVVDPIKPVEAIAP